MADPLLIQFLADHDAGCPVCLYGLRGLKSDRCPECGVPIRLGVHTPDTRLGSWITGLVLMSLATGFFAILSVLMLWMLEFDSPPKELLPVLIGAPIGLVMMGALFAFRRRYRRSGAAIRWGVNAVCTIVLYTLVALFFVMLM